MTYQEESLAFCAGQCQASRFPPASCRCICQGRNHGILTRSRQPINVTPYPYQNPYENFNRDIPQLPEERLQITAQNIGRELDKLPFLSPSRASETRSSSATEAVNLTRSKGKYRIAKSLGKALRHSIAGFSQNELNERIYKGLRVQLSQENTDLAIDQAFVIRQSKQPDANRPELYELYETGEIDQALEMMGKRWVIGRPKPSR